jgi:hypothetical protein
MTDRATATKELNIDYPHVAAVYEPVSGQIYIGNFLSYRLPMPLL